MFTISDLENTYSISGSCNTCGFCCDEVKVDYMLGTSSKCQFFRIDGLCDIQYREEHTEIPTVSEEQFVYYSSNCKTYPYIFVGQDASLLLADLQMRGWPPESCGYTLTELG